MKRVLVIDDDGPAAGVVEFLRGCGCAVEFADRGPQAAERSSDADVVLLGADSAATGELEVCRAIRAVSGVPVIVLLGVDDERDRITALRAGADDCVPRTCGPREVLARIDAVLRRCLPWAPPGSTGDVLDLGALHIHLTAREIWLYDRRVATTAKEFDLLHALASRPAQVHSRKELMLGVWHCDTRVPSRTLDTHVSNLRVKLGSRNWIVNVRGIGYRLGAAPDRQVVADR
ncbi:response regulator transcription factor [Actinokineospora globicatena]|uniref:response regulator transcription factor n=1 Tax=Actinokineospora globicatena TaxID=103729 RepID=UPI0020A42AFC|nr:response regulator transcription factor [Actinokineospora globicatena]MCP2305949.1 DNA-binding response regulator, OmpR family, contains REC and winged-helix (wHTH) domain [Actinokineospora globicatena]GLW80181.1 putative sensory transduction protein [Actinokineospora globicatena]GLW87010.1 putative sensory transduction protein [Actinokineospora globicatena]